MYTFKHATASSRLLPFTIIFFALLVAGAIIALPLYAQEDTIVFPIAELGNCESKDECRDYCDEPGNMRQCISFAKAHNLMTPEEAEIAEEFSETLGRQGGGPGGCTSPSRCQAYCENITNLNECLAFADEHGHDDGGIEEGRKIARYLKEGGRMPGECTSRLSCEAYCSDFNHGEECLLFAEGVGLEIRNGDHPNGPNREQLRVMIDLMNRGETPGGCTSERECEAYCSEGNNINECIAFGEKVGFISPEEAEVFRKTGGFGPGGCTSRGECDSFCNNPDNREQCFAFAKDHGLIDEREIQNLEEGLGQLKDVLNNAPEETRKCLRHNLGTNIISDIEAGTISPGPEFARTIEACIHKGFEEEGRREFGDMMQGMPVEVRSCIEEKVGGDIRAAFTSTNNNELEQVVKGCFESSRPAFDDNFRGDFDDNFDGGVFHREEGPRVFHDDRDFIEEPAFGGGFDTRDFGSGLFGNFSPEMKKCAIIRFGDNFERRLSSGELSPEELKRGINGCLQDLFQGQTSQLEPIFEPDRPTDTTRVDDSRTGAICTTEYAPVCGLKQVQCITTPCESIKRTYSNACKLKVSGATFVHRGECAATTDTTRTFDGTRTFDETRTFDGGTQTFDGTRQFEEFKIEEFKQFIEEPLIEKIHQELLPPPETNFDGTTRDFETQSALRNFLGTVLHATGVLFSR